MASPHFGGKQGGRFSPPRRRGDAGLPVRAGASKRRWDCKGPPGSRAACRTRFCFRFRMLHTLGRSPALLTEIRMFYETLNRRVSLYLAGSLFSHPKPQTRRTHFRRGQIKCKQIFEMKMLQKQSWYTTWGKSRATVVIMENNTIVNKYNAYSQL